MHKVRDRVLINVRTAPNGPVVQASATVFHVSKSEAKVLSDDERMFNLPAGSTRPSCSTPIPQALVARIDELATAYARTWKKGERASIVNDGERLYGTIYKGGAKPTMLIDGQGGAGISAPSGEFREGRPVEAEPPSVMDRWSVAKYKPVKALSEETTAYTAEILLDGKPVLHASNNGHGGSDMYRRLDGSPRDVLDQFGADAKAWYDEHGVDVFEPEGMWIHFVGAERPLGVTTAEHIEEVRSIFSTGDDAEPSDTAPRP